MSIACPSYTAATAAADRRFVEGLQEPDLSQFSLAGSVHAGPSSSFSIVRNPFLFPRDLLHAGETHDGVNYQPSVTLPLPVDPGDPEHWWLAHTKPRQEKKLAEQLAAKEIAYFLPVQEKRSLTRGKTRTSLLPCFSGYMFFKGNKTQRIGALETGRLVAAHRIEDGEQIRKRLWELADLIERGAQLTTESLLVPGRPFRVRSGLFKDKEGTVIKRGGKTRLFVFISDLLGGVSMEIEDHLLEPL